MKKVGILLGLGVVAVLPSLTLAETAAEARQALRARMVDRWEQLTEAERAVLEEQRAQRRMQHAQQALQRWNDLSEAEKQAMREERAAAIRRRAQQRLQKRQSKD